ncbi:hypothetical protein [Dyadobacter sediminis]|uniref:Uncharacterized protein n=1 Tax=Dyadobacter sediminis TaxID=1493691 RepID=A0A5R9KI06_9BACT|nr:hypothetical protein [Dyadobacter sediminis]TLU95857.1 hypothetical protein FEM55_01480 [Dyadobacter sediminis]GGB77138.1 hypothetical protein GCM10011325_00820 [Dyadobacter sediminis]
MMKLSKILFLLVGAGLLLGQASCNSSKHDDGISESMDSSSLDKTQTQIEPDSIVADSVNRP